MPMVMIAWAMCTGSVLFFGVGVLSVVLKATWYYYRHV